MTPQPTNAVLRAFTMLEVLVVVVVVGILAAIVVPQFGSAVGDARGSALKSHVSGVRASIAAYRSKQLLAGLDPYPTAAQLTTQGTVLQDPMPKNPFSGLSAVQSVSAGQASARSVSNQYTYGWNYYYDNTTNPPVCVFYANSSESVGADEYGADVPANTY